MREKDSAPHTQSDIDKAIDSQEKTNIEQTAREAEQETKMREPGAANGSQSNQHNNGRGGGK